MPIVSSFILSIRITSFKKSFKKIAHRQLTRKSEGTHNPSDQLFPGIDISKLNSVELEQRERKGRGKGERGRERAREI